MVFEIIHREKRWLADEELYFVICCKGTTITHEIYEVFLGLDEKWGLVLDGLNVWEEVKDSLFIVIVVGENLYDLRETDCVEVFRIDQWRN